MIAAKGEDRLARAKSYPFRAPSHSYLFVNGLDYEIAGFDADPVQSGEIRVDGHVLPTATLLGELGVRGAEGLDARVPVLAHGSNAAPEQLARKFAGFDGDVVIPVMRARLAAYDVVYAAHFTRYGAIPGTLEASPCTTAEIAITYLTPRQLARMHRTEIVGVNYVYGRLAGLELEPDGLPARDAAFVYLTRHGSVMLTGAPVALAAVNARNRRFRTASVPAMLALARDRIAPGVPLDAFIIGTIEDEALRRTRTAELRRGARRPTFADFEVLEG